jgi:hypothetical protein
MTWRHILVLAVVLAALGSAPAAKASCAPASPLRNSIAEADIVFVGTVVALDHDGRTATFRVEDVWKGKVGETVVVHGGPGIAAIESAAARGEGVASSVDRSYSMGTRYLVLPFGRSGDVLGDSICSNTRPYADGLASPRPASAHPPLADGGVPASPTASGDGSDSFTWPLVALLAAAGVTAGLAWLGLRARRA